MRMAWSQPENSNMIQNAPILGYRLSLAPSTSSAFVPILLGLEVQQYTIDSFFHGTYFFCSAENSLCNYPGYVRFGLVSGATWSTLLRSDGLGIKCSRSSGFRLDIDTGGKGQCQCNSDAIPLIRGQNFTARASAFSAIGESPECEVKVKVIGRPDQVVDLSAGECNPVTCPCTQTIF